VQYGKLIMLDVPNAAARRGLHAKHKAAAYAGTKSKLFIESSRAQALRITEVTRKPVFCIETWKMYA